MHHDLFHSINYNFLINTIGIGLAVLGILLSIKFTFHRTIELIQFTYAKEPVDIEGLDGKRTLLKLQMTFQNIGKEELYKKDVLNNIKIACDSAIVHMSQIVFESNCEYSTIFGKAGHHWIEFFPNFWDPSKLMRVNFEIITDQLFTKKYKVEDVQLTASCKIIGGDSFSRIINYKELFEYNYYSGRKTTNRYIFIVAFSVGLFLSILAIPLGIFNKTITDLWNLILKFNGLSIPIIILCVLLAILCFSVGFRLKYLLIPFGQLAKKEKKWFIKPLQADPADIMNEDGLNKSY